MTLESTKTVGLAIPLLEELATDTRRGFLEALPVGFVDLKIDRSAQRHPENPYFRFETIQFALENCVLHGLGYYGLFAGTFEVYRLRD